MNGTEDVVAAKTVGCDSPISSFSVGVGFTTLSFSMSISGELTLDWNRRRN
jgi:hypothetical protein